MSQPGPRHAQQQQARQQRHGGHQKEQQGRGAGQEVKQEQQPPQPPHQALDKEEQKEEQKEHGPGTKEDQQGQQRQQRAQKQEQEQAAGAEGEDARLRELLRGMATPEGEEEVRWWWGVGRGLTAGPWTAEQQGVMIHRVKVWEAHLADLAVLSGCPRQCMGLEGEEEEVGRHAGTASRPQCCSTSLRCTTLPASLHPPSPPTQADEAVDVVDKALRFMEGRTGAGQSALPERLEDVLDMMGLPEGSGAAKTWVAVLP